MAEIFSTLKRGGKEIAVETAKTDGMCKGSTNGGGSKVFGELKRSGKEIAVESAKTTGLCK